LSQTIYARYSYSPADIVWGARLADITMRSAEGETSFDYSHFDEYLPAEIPRWEIEGA
jgi:hypothetical protein